MFRPLGVKASEPGLKLIQSFEDFSARAYPDPLHGWLLPTIGYGTTIYRNGVKVRQGNQISEPEALHELECYLLEKIHPALQKIPGVSDMNAPMIGALESFAYNLGEGFYGGAHFNTITRVLREKEWSSMRKALLLYVNPGSCVEVGLTRRRNAEADLWEQGLLTL